MGNPNPNQSGLELGKWKPGQSGNPAGKKKGVPHSKTRLKRLLEITEDLTNPITKEVEGFTVAEQLDLAQIVKAKKGDTRAYNALMDRFEGKPTQVIDMSVNDELADTRSKIKEFLDDTDDGAYDEVSSEVASSDEATGDPEVAITPTDIS